MLWVNLIMDSLGSLALATEPPYEELLQREPTKRNESMINGRMWKHIVFQSLVQIILLVILYLIAPEFIKEQNTVRLAENRLLNYCYNEFPGKDVDHIIYGTEIKWKSTVKLINKRKAYCGKYASKQFLSEAYKEYINSNCATTHMSLIFNIFVFYTLFNQINCRVIDDSFNIFVRMNRSLLFPLICLLEMALQVAIIFIGSSPFHIVSEGLTGVQWGICIGFSAITFVVSFIMKLIPLQLLIDKWIKPKEEIVDDNEGGHDDINDIKIVPNIDSVPKVDVNSRRSKRLGSNRLFSRDGVKRITIGSRVSSNKNLNLYS
jgi:magnesium-transporting ATPase (P-type)